MKIETIPIDKLCRSCSKRKLLVEFDQNDKTMDRRETICRSCKEAIEGCSRSWLR
jgi:hypothetical protein